MTSKRIADAGYGLRSKIFRRASGRNKPWESGSLRAPKTIYEARGMLGAEERRALFWIGKTYYSGKGDIIDAGAYIGASAACMAAGLLQNPRAPQDRTAIRSYDFFVAHDAYVAQHITDEVRPLEIGEDYLDIYRDQTKAFAQFVEPIQGDLLAQKWSGAPIEVLFVDVAKTRDLNAHVVQEFFPHLIPGRSLLIHQDFYHGWHPYIHVTMEFLKDYFEILDGHIQGQSRLYLCQSQIPPETVQQVVDYQFSRDERQRMLDDFSSREQGDMRAMAEILKVCDLMMDGDLTGAEAKHAAFVASYENVERKGLWWQQALEQGAEIKLYLSRRADKALSIAEKS